MAHPLQGRKKLPCFEAWLKNEQRKEEHVLIHINGKSTLMLFYFILFISTNLHVDIKILVPFKC